MRDIEFCPDVEVFCRFLEMEYDADELLYYCYVRSLTQSVLSANFKAYWSDPGRIKDANNTGLDRSPPTLFLTKREAGYIAQTIFIRNAGGEEQEHEMLMHRDVMDNVKICLSGNNIDSSHFMRIAVERYFATRPGANDPPPAPPQPTNTPMQQQQQQQVPEPEPEPEPVEETFEYDHPLMTAVFSGEKVETAEAAYIDNLMNSSDFRDLPEQVRIEVQDDLAQELSQRLIDAETEAQECTTEVEFQRTIAGAIDGFDAMARLVAEHVQGLKAELNK